MRQINNVLSLFDGMSCGQIALKEIGIVPQIYYASEIDKHAIAQTQLNFPNTKQLGNVVNVDVSKLEHIDLLIGGSPCQSFSFAGKMKGMSTTCNEEIYTLDRYLELKAAGFEFEGQSYLFWEYMRILTDIRKYNPNVLFLLENVEMVAKWERVLSNAVGVFGVHINSALVSAQNRKRIYWTNIRTKKVGMFGDVYSDIPQPSDRGLVLNDILEEQVDDKYFLRDRLIATLSNRPEGYPTLSPKERNEKAACLCATMHKLYPSDNYVVQINPSLESGGKQPYQQNSIYDSIGKSPALCASLSGLAIKLPEATDKGYVEILPGECFDFEQPKSKTRRGRKMKDKSNTLMAQNMSFMNYTKDYKIRRLTPTECARLQTIPEWYLWNTSDTQQYRMLGNGWTIEIIKHIFKYL